MFVTFFGGIIYNIKTVINRLEQNQLLYHQELIQDMFEFVSIEI
jgi:hypothetical protein